MILLTLKSEGSVSRTDMIWLNELALKLIVNEEKWNESG